MSEQVSLTIDGQQVTVPLGTLVVDAAKKIGIDIPVFCYHPKMEPVGMCRMCLVDIGKPVLDRDTGEVILDEDGSPKIQFGWKLDTACTVPVSQGMVVQTMTEKVQQARKEILEFLLTSHPLDCPICDKGGECPLQNLTMGFGAGESRFLYDDKIKLEKNVPLGELIYLDRERCIQCARCTRFQKEIVDDPVIGFFQRGRSLEIVTFSDPGFDSYWSGNTTDICPVGALTTADFRFGARPWELNNAASICTHCPVGCNLTLNTRREAKSGGDFVIKRVMPRQNEQVNELWICDKGRFAYHFTESEERIKQPLVRQDGQLTPVSWEQALDLVASQMEGAGDGLLTLVSGRLPNEDLFNLNKLTQGVGGKTALYSQMAGGDLVAQVGVGTGTNFSDMGPGSVIFVVASDLEEEAPVWWLRTKQAAERGAILIVANPRQTKLDRYATHVIRYAYGEEVETVQVILDGQGEPGKAFAEADSALVIFGSEGTNLEISTALAQACANLLIATGKVGKPNNGLIPVWARANTQGAWDMGFRPAPDLVDKLGVAKMLYVIAADPAGDDPLLKETLLSQGSQPDSFLVVQELFLTETAELADVVLPALAPTEREGTFTSGERRVQRFYPAARQKDGCRSDFDIAAQIGERLNLDLKGRFPSLVMNQICQEIPDYAGLNYQKLAEVTEQWPLIGRQDLYYGGTSYKNSQGLGVQIAPASQRGQSILQAEVPQVTPADKDADLIALPVTRLYDHGRMVLPSQVLSPRLTEPFMAIHPADARRLKASEGMTVQVSLNGSTSPVLIQLDETLPVGFAILPRSMGIPINGPTPVEIQVAEPAMV
jgi:NADH-quinone oxidoreductase subunit G